MTRFTASALDLSRLDKNALFPDLSFESIRAERMADLKARLIEIGVPYDVEGLETDPGAVLQQSSGYRELLLRQAIRDAQTSVMLAFATGPFLDELGRQHATARLDGESDDDYRVRIQLAPEAFASAGTPGGYIYWAKSVSPEIRDVGLTVLDRGTPRMRLEIAILAKSATGAPSAALMSSVSDVLGRDDIRLATDVFDIIPASIKAYEVEGRLFIRRGPDPALVSSAARAALDKQADAYKRLGGDVPRTALIAALSVPGVHKVELTKPAVDVLTTRAQAAHMAAAHIEVEVLA